MTDACRILTPGMVHLDQLDADGLAEAVGMPDVPACLQALDSSRTFPLIFSLYIRYNGAILEPAAATNHLPTHSNFLILSYLS
jgi:hypothetical protein